jgi:hypothetical protein
VVLALVILTVLGWIVHLAKGGATPEAGDEPKSS